MDRLTSLIWLGGLVCLLVLVSWRTISCPYTKVEESFTIQAVHDILSYGIGPQALQRYDHQVFPGAVPRSFVGPILLAALSYPFILLSRLFGAVETSADVQSVVRLCLAAANVTSIAFFCQHCFATRAAVGKASASRTSSNDRTKAGLFLVITAVQFHYAFWVSRTIPNSLSLPFVVVAMALVCRNIRTQATRSNRGQHDARITILLLTFSAVVLRLEIVATILPVGLYLLATGQISLVKGLKTGIAAGAFSILITTMVDTYFWQDLTKAEAVNILSIFVKSLNRMRDVQRPRPLWPELDALLFNVVEGKSSEWGVSPWHAYVTSLVPKVLAFTSPLFAIGVLQLIRRKPSVAEERARFLLLTAATHIAVLSILGHKEWRFAFYILPALNIVSAIGACSLMRSWPGRVTLASLLLLQIGLSWFTGYLSGINYPGGEALKLLHLQLSLTATPGVKVVVHINVLPAMTGVTLFQSVNLERDPSPGLFDLLADTLPATCESDSCWVYDKTEDLPLSGPAASAAWSGFTHLITEASDCDVLQDESGAALPQSEQPFEMITPPIKSFADLRRKSVSQIKADLLRLPKALLSTLPFAGGSSGQTSFDHVMRLALPVIIVEQPSIWLCRRKDVDQ
ncbi:related to ALG12 - alpha-1,6-mannosyltransferase [Ustilago sp. UG-2017b]|nr:related to ALG12 - alpha-1,6-mannosyltransferase [Ustilago sp. UG-2017b]